jgi:glutamyl-tRNA reductase
VLRQVRHAAERARAEQASGPLLAALFRHAVEVGKRVRSETAISRGITSISHAAVALAVEHLGGSLSGRRVVVAGAGEVGAGMLRALDRMPGRATVAVANRTRSRGAELARRAGGEVVPLESLQRALCEADVLLTSTAAPAPVVRVADLEPVMVSRPDRPLLVVDAAVPRDVEPESRDVPGVTLLDLDDIRTYAEAKMTGRRAEVDRVRSIIGEEIERYRLAATGRSAAPLVSELRSHAESIRRAELDRYRARLGSMSPADRELVESLSKGIIAKLLHHPTVVVKEEAGSPRGERLAEALRALFDL